MFSEEIPVFFSGSLSIFSSSMFLCFCSRFNKTDWFFSCSSYCRFYRSFCLGSKRSSLDFLFDFIGTWCCNCLSTLILALQIMSMKSCTIMEAVSDQLVFGYSVYPSCPLSSLMLSFEHVLFLYSWFCSPSCWCITYYSLYMSYLCIE